MDLPRMPRMVFREDQQILPFETDRAADHATGGSDQAHDGEGRDGLSAPRLSHQGERLPGMDEKLHHRRL
ncbi:MAG: hypothetical protein R3B74_11505 [Nitrospirales bacterium]